MRIERITHLQEGVHDPYNFKAVFMAGAPGSGKSTVLRELFGGTGMKLIDADEVRRAYMDLGKGGDYGEYGKIVRKQRANYAARRLGILMDTTAWWLPSIQDTKHQLEELGYDVGMVHVYTPLQTSLDRVKQREMKTGRHVPEEEIVKRFQALKHNLRDYAEMFGDAFWFVDNSKHTPNIDLVKKHLTHWLKKPPSSDGAQTWVGNQSGSLVQEDSDVPTKKVSAGIIITDGTHLLLGHVTNKKNWDIPKGGIEVGENAAQAAIRELREETGIRANVSDIKYIGRFVYQSIKDLELFVMHVDKMPDHGTLDCKSMFTSEHDHKKYPEIDDFAVVTYDEALGLMNNNLSKIITKVWTGITS